MRLKWVHEGELKRSTVHRLLQANALASGLVFGLVFMRTRSIVAAVALHALNNLWVVLDWQVRATYDAAPILGWLCSPGRP